MAKYIRFINTIEYLVKIIFIPQYELVRCDSGKLFAAKYLRYIINQLLTTNNDNLLIKVESRKLSCGKFYGVF